MAVEAKHNAMPLQQVREQRGFGPFAAIRESLTAGVNVLVNGDFFVESRAGTPSDLRAN